MLLMDTTTRVKRILDTVKRNPGGAAYINFTALGGTSVVDLKDVIMRLARDHRLHVTLVVHELTDDASWLVCHKHKLNNDRQEIGGGKKKKK